jgi:ureidoglycolate lyase
MQPLKIKPVTLTAGNFSPYGRVFESFRPGNVINYGCTTVEFKHHFDQAVGIRLFRSVPLPQPMTLEVMERHPKSTQTFFPLDGRSYMVVVAEHGESRPGAIKAFIALGDQAVQYGQDVWHHYCLALGAPSRFLVEGGEGEDNLVQENLVQPIVLDFSS